MTFVLQSVVPADAHEIATVKTSAWYENPHWRVRWVDPSPEKMISCSAARFPWNLVNHREQKRHQKAIEIESGELNVWLEAGVAEPTEAERELFEKNCQIVEEDGRILGAKTDGVIGCLSKPVEKAGARIMGDEPYLILDYVAVTPKFQRRGIATMLTSSGLEIADSYGLKTYATASPAGLNVYTRLGFRIVETVSTDYTQFGGTEPLVHHFVVRQPVVAPPI